MKIVVKKKGASVRFQAENDEDGKALKEAVFAAAVTGFTPGRVLAELERLGYREPERKREDE
jgi:hypothetical protein